MIGTDKPRETSDVEIATLMRLGLLDARQALHEWSVTTPQHIFPERRIGRLAAGYEASFLVLAGNPLEDFGNTRRIELRVKQGQAITLEPVATFPVDLAHSAGHSSPADDRVALESRIGMLQVWDVMSEGGSRRFSGHTGKANAALSRDGTLVAVGDDDGVVRVKMTLTAPGCGMGPSIAMDAQRRIESLSGVAEADVAVGVAIHAKFEGGVEDLFVSIR